MPSGQEHVQSTLALCQGLRDSLAGLEAADEAWRSGLELRLTKVEAVLEGLKDRFFLRSRLCLPFAERCEREATQLGEVLGSMGVQGAGDAEFRSGLEALEKAARALDSRSAMQGMAIT